MATNKRLTDLIDYTSVLPYASEMFGIYQPLIGWKSKRIADRFNQGFLNDKHALLNRLKSQFNGLVDISYNPDCQVSIELKPGALKAGKLKTFDSILMEKIAENLPPYEKYKPNMWPEFINPDEIKRIIKEFVTPAYTSYYVEYCLAGDENRVLDRVSRSTDAEKERALFLNAFESQLRSESSLAGALLFMVENKNFNELATMFYSLKNNTLHAIDLAKTLLEQQMMDGYLDLNNMDPQDQEHIRRVALSPISVVHLFRQYFFELDTFLGTPVSHVWMSPGSTVELIEISTRRTLVEKTLETSLESITKTESVVTEQEEISDAVKEDNKQDIKFGASVTASYASITATSNFDYNTSQQSAREETHKRMRQQTEKLSTEIRKNYKTTFKTITETTDSSSKRYVLSNTTEDLINYELRRKMRQVAVQVQDIGSYLCWQTYVDRPGEDLGVAKLIHIAKPAELDGLHAPEEIPMLQPFSEDKVVTLPFVSIQDTDADNEGEVYKDGVEVDDSEAFGELEKVQSDFLISDLVCPKGNYVLTNVEFDGQGKPVAASRKGEIVNNDNKAQFTLHLNSVDFQGQNSVQVKLKLHWSPAAGANDGAIKKNNENQANFKAKEASENQKAIVQAAKERVKASHEIKPRPSEELREEERIVVYRKLIQEMLTNGIQMPDDRTRHMVAELINSIFDVDKMLYFVAPEWWRPQLREYVQQLDESTVAPVKYLSLGRVGSAVAKKKWGLAVKKSTDKLTASTVGWGGLDDLRRDNYYITEDSQPAKLGSSLGWLLQLDGDNMRNAFLNAPWVKAVIPIRPGKEEAAVNWLKGVEGFNGIGDDDVYQTNNPNEKDINGNPLDGQKMIDVIMDLAKKIQMKHQEAVKKGKYPSQDEIADPPLVDEENVVTSTPIDRVYEHGFYPLQGGFRANVKGNYEIFDQWLEILPTDQVVPVEVKYDPKTGRQI
ncbi:MAG: hypothetical protein CVU39_24980 [Chloroflexi bacterium HGW-Chloroflexi-10]|nr:MAG: hypothetical protein CVU39_24980 [Chloroflexi bacterium HGW-Chloroflexi-10]